MPTAKVELAVDLFRRQRRAQKRADDLERDVRRSLIGMSQDELACWFYITEEIIQKAE